MEKPHIIVVCGPTATGKSDYAVALAKRIDGEIISADSRQVYKGLDIGSGKISNEEMQGIPHYMLDIAHPSITFSVAEYVSQARPILENILERKKIPIICGGTGFYISALAHNQQFPSVAPNHSLRAHLELQPIETLREQLHTRDPRRFETIDIHNKVRLIRALEIIESTGIVPKVPPALPYSIEWIYLDFPDQELKERIHTRLMKRFDMGMIKEVEDLVKDGVPYERLYALGLEYRYIAEYLKGAYPKETLYALLEKAIWQYAKRQRTWFKKYANKKND